MLDSAEAAIESFADSSEAIRELLAFSAHFPDFLWGPFWQGFKRIDDRAPNFRFREASTDSEFENPPCDQYPNFVVAQFDFHAQRPLEVLHGRVVSARKADSISFVRSHPTKATTPSSAVVALLHRWTAKVVAQVELDQLSVTTVCNGPYPRASNTAGGGYGWRARSRSIGWLRAFGQFSYSGEVRRPRPRRE